MWLGRLGQTSVLARIACNAISSIPVELHRSSQLGTSDMLLRALRERWPVRTPRSFRDVITPHRSWHASNYCMALSTEHPTPLVTVPFDEFVIQGSKSSYGPLESK